ncbi:hypothetical protein KGF54_002760 [Candida jiufengensis]|uniref:uncharacterized protein n=1 Tax=Candida jiufengensis TaxID=497108 RepID=UPI0022244673|nr:uncharacterized protein KGF54_002760 [Candida jiufengensis]KAI5953388.1 hypothetical protein KGF54_002760 [Candida jiufengensis]
MTEQSTSTMSIKLDANDIQDIQDKIKNNIPYPEPIKSKSPFKQQPFDFRNNKIQKLSVFPSKEQKNENSLKKYSDKASIRAKYFIDKSWVLVKESSTIIFYDFINILYNILEILITIIIFIFFTFRGLYYFTIEILFYFKNILFHPIVIISGVALLFIGIPFGLLFGLLRPVLFNEE